MTFREVIDQKIRAVRLPHWADPKARLEPHYMGENHGPWVTLYDCGTEQQILVFDLLNDAENRYVVLEGDDDDK